MKSREKFYFNQNTENATQGEAEQLERIKKLAMRETAQDFLESLGTAG